MTTAAEAKQLSKWRLVFTGFRQVDGMRVFAFDNIAPDNSRKAFTVTANLAMSRSYGISMQELPLLCRALVENPDRDEATEATRALTYTEAHMQTYAAGAAARSKAAKARRPPKRPIGAAAAAGGDAAADTL